MGLQNKKKPCHAQLEGIVTIVRNPYIAGIIATMLQRETSLDYSSLGAITSGGCLYWCADDRETIRSKFSSRHVAAPELFQKAGLVQIFHEKTQNAREPYRPMYFVPRCLHAKYFHRL